MKRRQVAILAGGLGTRLRPITEKIPKPMVDVAGKPFLYWQLCDLREQGYTEIVLLVAYLGEQIESHFGNGERLGLQLKYVYEPSPLGTGGALKNALDHLDEEFLLLNGDSFLRLPLGAMEEAFTQGHYDALISTYDNRLPVPVIPNLQVSGNHITAYKKDAGLAHGFNIIDSGVYLLKRSLVLNYPFSEFMLADLWPSLIEKKTLGAFAVAERFYDIGTLDRLKEFEEKISDYFAHTVTN